MGTINTMVKISFLRVMLAMYARKNTAIAHRLESTDAADPQRSEILKRHNDLQYKRIKLESELTDARDGLTLATEDFMHRRQSDEYVRPNGLFGSYINKRLGPLPRNAKKITATVDDMNQTRSHTTLVFFLAAGVLSIAYASEAFAPWASFGLASLLFPGAGDTSHASFSLLHVLAIGYLGFFIMRPASFNKYFFNQAIESEQNFRMGFEYWSWSQRGFSYIAVALSHIVMFVLYPYYTVLLLSVPAMVASKVYLDAHRRTHDAQIAVLESAKVSSGYTKFVLLFVSLVVLLPWLFHLITS